MNILIKINSLGDFVFPSSKYCVVFNKKKNVQVFYEGHSVNNIGHLDAIEGLSTTTTPDGLTVQETFTFIYEYLYLFIHTYIYIHIYINM